MKLLVLLGLVVYSASQKNFIEQWFTSMDTNHDDLIEKGEIRAAFHKFDLNDSVGKTDKRNEVSRVLAGIQAEVNKLQVPVGK